MARFSIVTVTLSAASTQTVTVAYTTGNGTATAGSGLREEADLHKMLRAASDDEARAILTELRERFPARQPYVEEALLPLV